MHSPQDDASPLLQSLLKARHVRPFYNGTFHPGGLEIDRNFNWWDICSALRCQIY